MAGATPSQTVGPFFSFGLCLREREFRIRAVKFDQNLALLHDVRIADVHSGHRTAEERCHLRNVRIHVRIVRRDAVVGRPDPAERAEEADELIGGER